MKHKNHTPSSLSWSSGAHPFVLVFFLYYTENQYKEPPKMYPIYVYVSIYTCTFKAWLNFDGSRKEPHVASKYTFLVQ